MLSKYGFESRRGAQNGVKDGLDVHGDIPGWRGEVKNCKDAEWSKWWIQAQDATRIADKPYVAWKPLRKPWRVRTISGYIWPKATNTAILIEMDGDDAAGDGRDADWGAVPEHRTRGGGEGGGEDGGAAGRVTDGTCSRCGRG
jgi:hypothetical protein